MDDQNSPEKEWIARPYQVELAEMAVKQNTIIHLPTGSGKTFIATGLIARFKKDLSKPWGQGGKRTFFLVNTVPLVEQQSKVISARCPVNGVGSYSSEDKVDYWDKYKWDMELQKNEVMVMTCEILKLMLQHAFISLSDINLLIFDECHHAVDDHPMRQIMKHFDNCPVDQRPIVLGLTATLLNANEGTLANVEKAIKKLETTFHAVVATVNEMGEVLPYSTNPHEMLEVYAPPINTDVVVKVGRILENLQALVMEIKLPSPHADLRKTLRPGQKDISVDPMKIVKEVKNMIADMKYLLDTMGVYGGSIGVIAYTINLERLKRRATTEQEAMLYRIVITQTTMAQRLLENSMEGEEGMRKLIKHSSPQILLLLDILKEYNPKAIANTSLLRYNRAKKPLSAIIFTQRKFTAKVLYNLLSEVVKCDPETFGFLKHEFVVGYNINPFKNTREQHYIKKTNQKAFLKFRNGDLNCLIATNVIEEGVDISQCLLVVRYDPPLEYRSYIQSKGRARSKDSTFVLMISQENFQKFSTKYSGYLTIERHIQQMLVGQNDQRLLPTEEELQRLYQDEDIEPYINPYSGSKLSASAAISLLNRYCSTLPHDQFTRIIPQWVVETKTQKDGGKTLLITLTMPIACPLKHEIKGEPRPQLKAAKRTTALRACIELHKCGELDRETMLPKAYAKVNFESEDVKSCFPNWPWDEKDEPDLPKPGTKKRMRKHDKVYPSCMEGKKHWKTEQQTFYLHVIDNDAAFTEPEDPRDHALYELLQRSGGYAFITYKPLPKLCQFPMFLVVGEVTVNIKENYCKLDLDKDQFTYVKRFHHFLFDQVLDVAKKFVVHDGGVNTLYVVPTIVRNGKKMVDWHTIMTYESIPPYGPPLPQVRKDLVVTKEHYQYAVITPWYRIEILPHRYVVSNVLEYLTPQSQFDTNSYDSYQQYYNSKYGLELLGPQDQPLLEVKNISSRMNCLLPRAATLNTLTDKQKKLIAHAEGDTKPSGFLEILIPEYCIRYDYPGELWYKAMMLPSVVHRVTMLLIAEELRSKIARQTKLGFERLPPGEEWLPITKDENNAVKALLSQVEEPNQVQTIDRINNPINDEEPRPVNIVSMKEAIYELQTKKLSKEFAWDEEKEPMDIDRNLIITTVMDIECYDEFAMAPLVDKNDSSPLMPNSPVRMTNVAALPPPPVVYNDEIVLLSRTAKGRAAELKDVTAALTAINSNDMLDLERVETLGDSFLKFAASLYLHHKFPKLNEGQLTNIKGQLIGNRNLYYAGKRINLGGMMKLEQFSPRTDFVLPGFSVPVDILECIENSQVRPTFLIGVRVSRDEALSGAIEPATLQKVMERRADSSSGVEVEPPHAPQPAMQCYVHKQVARDKTIADGVEALIGTYVQSSGIEGGVRILEWLRVLPPEDDFLKSMKTPVETVFTRGQASQQQINFIINHTQSDVERILNYKFKDPSLLLEALSHPSYIRNRYTNSYERLEFLGDAILDFLITAYIFEQHRQLKPGDLTDLRSALVNNVTFASYTVKLGLQKYLCFQFNPVLESAIINFVEYQTQRRHQITEDVLYLIDEQDCMVAEYVEVPKVLSDIFEALAGAIYVDSGGDAAAVWRVYYRVMRRELADFAEHIPIQPVRLLHEKIHACAYFGTAKKVSEDIDRMMVPVTVTKAGQQYTVHGLGGNKEQARRAAAKLALKVLGT